MLNCSSISRCTLKGYPQSPQFDGKRFANVAPRQSLKVSDYVKMFWDLAFNKPKESVPAQTLPVLNITAQTLADAADNSVFRLGHSSLLLKLQGKYWLTDPVFTLRASPFQWLGPKRFQPAPIELDALPPIEGIILSHDHYDHLDYQTIMQLKDRVRYFLTPLGVGDLLVKWGVAQEKITQLDWWQSVDIGALHFVSTPAQHFSGRGLFDSNKRLWCSWSIISDEFRLFFGGDSGYFPGFKEIGQKYGPFDVACLENGAYDSRWADIHMLPSDTLRAFQDLQGKWLLPIHNAAFDLAFHHWNDPFKQIVALAREQQIKLSLPKIGQGVNILQPQEEAAWW
ncbi:MBL fold metallo-hydrolase [Pantoea rodasii]|uniref:MBL fold metallo-hydrolase n=1 Tax=Pantoea rodasii TaxID=1076549 RepID=A0A2M9W760_9GAMM|nr:MBL fold metallo-hydrolase [Pantoea rodasii]ORM65387.1 MBL fold metallo-hydrolase [Pantoea rodasii]PJZ03380.1 MBL fold metallo-hydrolase [Pantoea rodasii]